MNSHDNVTKVLIAHITKDKRAAESLRNRLLDFGGDRLKCFLWCEENRQNSLEDLQDRIHETDLLLLFVASGVVDNEDWFWLQSATVMSRFMSNGHVHRIFLHNRTLTPPRPIREALRHSFRSELGEIEEFLRYFFSSGEFTQNRQGLNINFAQDRTGQVNNTARDIISLFSAVSFSPNEYIFPRTIALIANNPDNLTEDNLVEEIWIRAETERALEIFSLFDTGSGGNTNRRLEDLVSNSTVERNPVWFTDLRAAVYEAHKRRIPPVVQSTFRSSDNKLFRPILYKMETLSDGSEQFIVLFEEHISKGWVDKAPSISLATLLTALILGARLQWEVCDEYLPMLDQWQQEGPEAIKKNLLQVKVLFENIEKDAELRRKGEAPEVRNEVILRNSFDSENEKEIIKDNLEKQEKYKRILRNANTQDNVNEVRAALTELRRLNSIVMAMLATRYSQLLTQLRNENYA